MDMKGVLAMYIEEVQKRKDELEKEITEIVLEFEKETHTQITDLRLRRIESTTVGSEYKGFIPRVELTVELQSKNR